MCFAFTYTSGSSIYTITGSSSEGEMSDSRHKTESIGTPPVADIKPDEIKTENEKPEEATAEEKEIKVEDEAGTENEAKPEAPTEEDEAKADVTEAVPDEAETKVETEAIANDMEGKTDETVEDAGEAKTTESEAKEAEAKPEENEVQPMELKSEGETQPKAEASEEPEKEVKVETEEAMATDEAEEAKEKPDTAGEAEEASQGKREDAALSRLKLEAEGTDSKTESESEVSDLLISINCQRQMETYLIFNKDRMK